MSGEETLVLVTCILCLVACAGLLFVVIKEED